MFIKRLCTQLFFFSLFFFSLLHKWAVPFSFRKFDFQGSAVFLIQLHRSCVNCLLNHHVWCVRQHLDARVAGQSCTLFSLFSPVGHRSNSRGSVSSEPFWTPRLQGLLKLAHWRILAWVFRSLPWFLKMLGWIKMVHWAKMLWSKPKLMSNTVKKKKKKKCGV